MSDKEEKNNIRVALYWCPHVFYYIKSHVLLLKASVKPLKSKNRDDGWSIWMVQNLKNDYDEAVRATTQPINFSVSSLDENF